MTIEMRPLGQTGTEVTILGYGAMELRGLPRGPAIDDEEAGRLLNAVLDAGINLIDTAIDYGRSEELIGRYIGHRRDEYFLASKCGCLLDTPPAGARPPYPHDYSAANVRAGVEQSLTRLGTDHLDLVQVHMSPGRADMDAAGTVAELVALRPLGLAEGVGPLQRDEHRRPTASDDARSRRVLHDSLEPAHLAAPDGLGGIEGMVGPLDERLHRVVGRQ
jgi:aryl-alcohol dehydrogenase-like predicted oxidoreductase